MRYWIGQVLQTYDNCNLLSIRFPGSQRQLPVKYVCPWMVSIFSHLRCRPIFVHQLPDLIYSTGMQTNRNHNKKKNWFKKFDLNKWLLPGLFYQIRFNRTSNRIDWLAIWFENQTQTTARWYLEIDTKTILTHQRTFIFVWFLKMHKVLKLLNPLRSSQCILPIQNYSVTINSWFSAVYFKCSTVSYCMRIMSTVYTI
jgi:hypothetical protein